MRFLSSFAGWLAVLFFLVPAPAAAQLRTEVVVEGLTNPVAFIPDPTSRARFFIVEQGGLVRLLENGVLTTFLDLRSQVLTGGEQGLLGMAFAPDAATSGRFFVNFTSPAGDIVVSRFRRLPADAPVADVSSRFDLVWPGGLPHIPHPTYENHNGGHLAFGPDGFLYIGTGDGGGGNDPFDNAQNARSLLGKMLRIDVNVPDGHATGYIVPPTNPFIGTLASEEIWDFGLRNPWRYSFDDFGPSATGALVIADVGQSAREEVNYEPPLRGARNYGWSLREGRIATPGQNPAREPAFTPLTDPIFDYPRTIGRAITGGYVYRGTQLPSSFRGRYFVADSSTSVVGSIGLRVDATTGEASVIDAVDHSAELGGALGGVVSFGRDLDGELYLVTFSGRILKIVAAGAPGAPTELEASLAGRTVRLQWSAPADQPIPTAYRVEAGTRPGASDIAEFTTGATPRLAVTGVPDGVYYVRVRALAGDVPGPASNEVPVTVIGCAVPAAPTGLTSGGSGLGVTLAWEAAPGASTYLVEAGSGPGLNNLYSFRVGGVLGVTGTVPAGTYYARVRGVNECGAGPASNEVVVLRPAP